MAVVDQAGNLSDKYISGYPILLDKTPPAITGLTIGGFTQYGSGYYLTNPSGLVLNNFTISEDVSDIAVKKYSIVDTTSGSERTSLTADWEDIQKIVLTSGEKYRIKAEVVNTAGAY